LKNNYTYITNLNTQLAVQKFKQSQPFWSQMVERQHTTPVVVVVVVERTD